MRGCWRRSGRLWRIRRQCNDCRYYRQNFADCAAAQATGLVGLQCDQYHRWRMCGNGTRACHPDSRSWETPTNQATTVRYRSAGAKVSDVARRYCRTAKDVFQVRWTAHGSAWRRLFNISGARRFILLVNRMHVRGFKEQLHVVAVLEGTFANLPGDVIYRRLQMPYQPI